MYRLWEVQIKDRVYEEQRNDKSLNKLHELAIAVGFNTKPISKTDST